MFPGVLDSDHSCVIASVDVSVPHSLQGSRECFDFGKTKWGELKRALKVVDWSSFFSSRGPEESAAYLTDYLLDLSKSFIPTKTVSHRPYKHPWINDNCREALRKKHSEVGKPGFEAARDACTAVFRRAHAEFLEKSRKKLKTSSPRDWWKLSKELLAQTGGKENIPPLKVDDKWCKDAEAKANLLSETFAHKSELPDRVYNEYSPIQASEVSLPRFLRIRVRDVRKILRNLDETSGTGPDGLPAIILRRCGDELALPITLLSRMCLTNGCWPSCWRLHWIHPLHKRKSKADPNNYRGVHLTSQLSKVVERAVGGTFVPWLGEHAFGENQYAYSAGKSHRDVLAINVCSWLLLMEGGQAAGLYCSDVSGAFDRVSCERLCAKLRASGLPDCAVSFLQSWLEDRISIVVVAGA